MSTLISDRFVRFLRAMAFTLSIVTCLGVMLSLIPDAGVVDALTRTSVVTEKKVTYETSYLP